MVYACELASKSIKSIGESSDESDERESSKFAGECADKLILDFFALIIASSQGFDAL